MRFESELFKRSFAQTELFRLREREGCSRHAQLRITVFGKEFHGSEPFFEAADQPLHVHNGMPI